jgi:ABC-type transport system involved in multi-copper enzyme maturation permease subunit
MAQAEDGVVRVEAVIGNPLLKSLMNSLAFRIMLLIMGVCLVLFYGMLLPAALVNLPVSLPFLLYCSVGMLSGILCFVYFSKKKKSWLVLIVPFIIFMIITVVNMMRKT